MPKEKVIKNTTYAVLGILGSGQSMSGYDIKKVADQLQYFYWSPAQSHIYTELKKLEKLAYVHSEKVNQEGKPNKRLYTITKEGTAVFQSWLNDPTVDSVIIKHPLLLRLFFSQWGDSARLQTAVQTYIASIEENLAQIAIAEEYYEHDDDEDSHHALIARWNRRHQEAELATAKEILETFSQKLD